MKDGKLEIGDFMVGDLIRAFGVVRVVNLVHKRGLPGDIDYISTSIPGFEFPRTILSFHPEHAEPIPLTIEILENNGFAAKNYYADSLGVDNLFVDEYAKCGVWADQKDGYDFDTIVECNFVGESDGFAFATSIRGIKYVHELQHALKLCGIEKEIKL